jgi:hypothetical protein
MLNRSTRWLCASVLALSAWGCAQGYSAEADEVQYGTAFAAAGGGATSAVSDGAVNSAGATGSVGATSSASAGAPSISTGAGGTGAVSSTSSDDDLTSDACRNAECRTRLQCVLRRANADCNFTECRDGLCR